MLQVRPEITQVVQNAILVTGPARSGTSLMGTLVHSLEGVEYVYEPPLLYGLMPLLGKMDPVQWRFLFETYLFEDVLVDALAGRRINLNIHDESGIRRAKSQWDVESRLNSQARRMDLFYQALSRKVAFKQPDILPWVCRLQEYYPEIRVVAMFREPEASVDSLVNQQWFSGQQSMSNVLQGPWQSLSPDIPFWVPEGQKDDWEKASPLDRAYLYWLWQVEALMALDPQRICLVNYDDLARYPNEHFQRVVEYLRAYPTPQTAALIQSVARPERPPTSSLGLTRPDLRERAEKMLQAVGLV